ncbi:hypothetical protein AACH06_24440 [Ideonella sp. DXS29W]|uniref:Uncharacterized protein n=1 Tax=Ideonella lacteola TaxID=2984193 RepID=A0ABU9BVJ6_9BURK
MTQRLKNLLSNTNAQLGYSHFDAMLVIAVLGYFALALADLAGLKG